MGIEYKFSLIMPTINRYREIESFFYSLENQKYKNFEVIVIDQNSNDLVENIIKRYSQKFEIKYYKSNQKGLSLNRNIGIEKSTGDIIAFPDDDCEYLPDTLEKINNFFSSTNYSIYSCGVKDFYSDKKFKFKNKNLEITNKNIMNVGCSITFFIKQKNEKLYFDEKLGVGAKFGSGEETDYISNLIIRGAKGYYYYEDYVLHEVNKKNITKEKYYSYGLGLGALLYKEIKLRRNYFFLSIIIKRIIKSMVATIIFFPDRAKHLNHLLGIYKGYTEYSK